MRALVLALIAAFSGLLVAGLFVLDWFVIERSSVDLWAVAHCNAAGCFSKPIETLAAFHPYAITTLWLIAIAVTPVLLQTGAYLFAGTTRRRAVTALGYAASMASTACVLITAYVRQPMLHGQRGVASAAPFVVVCGLALGTIALRLATKPASRIPAARVRTS